MNIKKFSLKTGILLLSVLGSLLLVSFLIFLAYSFGLAQGERRLTDFSDSMTSHVINKRIPDTLNTEEVDFDSFWRAWALLEDKFAEFPSASSSESITTDQDRVWGAIQGLTASYGDPYTVFFPPEETKFFEADIKGEFTGVGMEIGTRDGVLTVISPLPNTPAERAGMRAKDRIIKIDGLDSSKMNSGNAVKLIRGPKGEPVTLTVLREGVAEELEITIIRDTILIPTIDTQIDDDVFIIKLYSFTSKSPELFRDALRDFVNSGNEKLILDLRGNPGGFLQAAVSMASWFLPETATIVTEDRGDGAVGKEYKSDGYNIFTDNLDMIILTNEGSASASEILAGALRDYDKALLVGQTTFGKGSVQELVNITDETSLKVTIARWLTPSGDHISEDGIQPDVFVENDSDLDNDTVLEKALEIIRRSDFKSLYEEIPEDLQPK